MRLACVALLAFVAIVNLSGAFAAYLDKQVALRRGRRRRDDTMRVPERVFLLLSFLGGWPMLLGAFFALRHKTQKRGFLAAVAVLGALGTAVLWGWLAALGCAPFPSRPSPP